jgi:hypothetical protein
MKNIYRLFITLCLLVTTGIVKGQMNPGVLLLDSVYTYNWASNAWSLNIKEYCTKNATGQTTQDLFLKFNSGTSQFQDYIRSFFGYSDTITVPTSVTDQFWYNNIWNTYQHDHYLARNIPDTTYSKTMDFQHHVFANGVMNIYQYNDSLLPVVSITMSFDTTNQTWVNLTKTTNTYTAHNQPLEQILYSWQSSTSTWNNVLKYDNVYDANNLLVTSMEYTWNEVTATWISAFRTTWHYNLLTSLPDTMMKESYDSIMQVWDSVQRSTYIYNQYNWLMTIPTQIHLQSVGAWVNSSLTFYSYSPYGVQNSETDDIWDSIHSTYITTAFQKTDSATGKLGESFNLYVNTQTFLFTGGIRNVYTYGATGDSLNWLNQQWDVTGGDWVNKSQVSYTYDSHDLLTEKVGQAWVVSSSSWLNSSKSDYFYSPFGGIWEHPSKEKPCIYANPMVTGSMIYCPDFKTGEQYTLRVCSLSGVDVYRTTFMGGEEVKISRSLIPGLYFLIIEENNQVVYKDKIIVTH